MVTNVRLSLLIFALLGPVAAAAQTKPAAISPAPLTLAKALLAIPAPSQGIVLTVGADKVTLPSGMTAPPPGEADAPGIAAAFGEQTQTFGIITTIAPATRVILNDSPAAPDLSADLHPFTAFQMLAASLEDAQWAALTSERGLGLSDLTDPTQQLLFHALFRHGHLWVASQDPTLASLPDDQRTDTRDVSDQIDGVRVRLGQTAHLYVHDRLGKTIYHSQKPADALQRLHTWSPKQDPPAAQHNVALRAVIANTPRSGDLRLDDAAFQASIPLAGLRTVDDLVARIAARTHRELYADPHYAHRALTLIGPASSAPASDLLGALALAVAGTYRQVGPAFVLTDDIIGVGTRRQRVSEWEDMAFSGELALGEQAGAALLKRRASAARTLPSFGDPVALMPVQLKELSGTPDGVGVPDQQHSYPFAKLTPAQKEWAHRTAATYEEERASDILPDYLTQEDLQDADPSGAVDLRANTNVQFLIPTVEGPVDTNLSGPLSLLYWPGMAAYEEYEHKATQKPPVLAPAPPLMPLLRSRPRRALLGHPRTIAEVDALIAAMQKIGLNELWLDVFSGGTAHVPGTTLSDKALPADGPDILTEALTKTQGTGITVYADLSLLPWGSAPPEAARDLSIEGEPSRERAVHAHDRSHDQDFDDAGKPIIFAPPPVAVSPLSAQVRSGLTALVRALSVRPRLAGFVWEDAEADNALGYTPEMRLMFLRVVHADPVDITPDLSATGDVSLPTFDDAAADKALPPLWDKARLQVNAALLGGMRQALSPTAAARPILMEQSAVRTEWLASWDDPRQLPPPLRPLFPDVSFPSPAQIAVEARKQGRAVLLRERVPDAADTDALARALQTDLKNAPWDGFVLDFADEDATRSRHPLDALIRASAQADKPASR